MRNVLVIRIRVNKTERGILEARALKQGKKLTRYCRDELLPKYPKKLSPPIEAIQKPIEVKEATFTRPQKKEPLSKQKAKPVPQKERNQEITYRRFAEPGALLKK